MELLKEQQAYLRHAVIVLFIASQNNLHLITNSHVLTNLVDKL